MSKSVSIRFTENELFMLRHAVQIGMEDVSLLDHDDEGNLILEEQERADRIYRKLTEAIQKVRP